MRRKARTPKSKLLAELTPRGATGYQRAIPECGKDNIMPKKSSIGLTLQEKRELCQAHVFLDDKPARIVGARLDFATVYQTPNGQTYEWAWETVARIIENGGRFYS